MRVKIVLACTECKQRNYNTKKNKKNDPDRLEMNKYCRFCVGAYPAPGDQVRSGTMAETEKKTAKKPEEKKPNALVRFGKRAVKFFKDCKGEVKKIVWPTPKSVFKNTGVVLVTIIVLGLFVFLLDTVFMNLLGLVMDVARPV